MGHHDHHGDCDFDYNSSWDYSDKPRRSRPRRGHKGRDQRCWDTWS